MNNAALWLRVSTGEQTTENQRRLLADVAQRRGWTVAHEYDVTASAFKGEQVAALDAMLADASLGHFQTLLVWSLDRLSRQGGEEVLALIAQLASRNVSVVSIQEPWVETMRDPMMLKFLTFVAGWFGEFEARKIKERTLAGLARARAEGKRLGRPPGKKDGTPGARRRGGYVMAAEKREAEKRRSRETAQ